MDGIGTRIASSRRLLGLTQDQLAQRTHYSVSTVRAVEQGREPASPAFTAACARALSVELEQLQGTPPVLDQSPSSIMAVRRLLAEGRHVRAEEPDGNEATEVSENERRSRDDTDKRVFDSLPSLIRRLHGVVHNNPSGHAHTLLATAYYRTARLTRRMGHVSLSATAIDRMEYVAESADDPALGVLARIERARSLMYLDDMETAMALVDSVIVGSPPTPLVLGHAHLCGAIVAARGRRHALALDHVQEARELAGHTDDDPDTYSIRFGMGNVEIHGVAVELESGDPGKAATEGSRLTLPADMAGTRVGHHWQDTARAWLLSGEPTKALRALNRARQAAPEQTRSHPSVRETLRGIAEAERRRTDSLVAFAQWLHVRV